MTSPFPRTAVLAEGWLTHVGGIDVAELARSHGTPLYVMDHATLVGRMRAYRAAFTDEVAVTYAAKALCVVGVLQLAAAEGLHLDVASSGELHTAERAGFPMDRVIFHGNNKSTEELVHAARLKVGRIVVDSFSELARLADVGAGLDCSFDVLLRVTPGVEAHTHEFIRTGHDDSKFGFTLSAGLADQAVARALETPRIRLRGVHCHVGSQIFTVEAFGAAARALCAFVAEVRARHGVELSELNLGGGLGIVYGDGDDPPPVDTYAAAVLGAVERESTRLGLGPLRVSVEPGRSIVGPAGLTLYRIGTVKDVPGLRTYLGVDGGMSDNLRPALYGARYTFAPAGTPTGDGAQRVVTVAGKHCETGDVLGTGVRLPGALGEGGLLAVAATGAYGHAMASNYNRLPRPAMVLVGDGQARLLVRRETLGDVVARDVPLEQP